MKMERSESEQQFKVTGGKRIQPDAYLAQHEILPAQAQQGSGCGSVSLTIV
jgi:hypothetical protein